MPIIKYKDYDETNAINVMGNCQCEDKGSFDDSDQYLPKISPLNKPHFYLKILNGYSMSFGIRVFLGEDRQHEIFSINNFSDANDYRIALFKQFVCNENLGLLTFSFDIYHEESYINMLWSTETRVEGHIRSQDCRKWIWDLNGMRNRVLKGEAGTTGEVLTYEEIKKRNL